MRSDIALVKRAYRCGLRCARRAPGMASLLSDDNVAEEVGAAYIWHFRRGVSDYRSLTTLPAYERELLLTVFDA